VVQEAAYCCSRSYCRKWRTRDSKWNVCPNFHVALSGQTPCYCSVRVRVWGKYTLCFAL